MTSPHSKKHKISSKLKKLKTNFGLKTSFIIKMSRSELMNSAVEDENNGTEESETSDDEYLSDFTKLRPYMYEAYVSKESVKENYPGRESSDSEEHTSSIGNTLCCSLEILMQNAFATFINMKFVKVNSKVYFGSFLKYFYPVIC